MRGLRRHSIAFAVSAFLLAAAAGSASPQTSPVQLIALAKNLLHLPAKITMEVGQQRILPRTIAPTGLVIACLDHGKRVAVIRVKPTGGVFAENEPGSSAVSEVRITRTGFVVSCSL